MSGTDQTSTVTEVGVCGTAQTINVKRVGVGGTDIEVGKTDQTSFVTEIGGVERTKQLV